MTSSAASLSPANASCETQSTRSSYTAVIELLGGPDGISGGGTWARVTWRTGKTVASVSVSVLVLTGSGEGILKML